jgi:hypothetical protein
MKKDKQEIITSNKQKRNGWKFFGIICIILIILVGGYFGYVYLANSFYSKGYNLGNQNGQISIIQSIQSTGEIPYLTNVTGKWEVKTITIKDVCGNLQAGA